MTLRALASGVALLGTCICLQGCGQTPVQPTPAEVYHFVAFAYSDGVNAAEVREKFLELKDTCLKDGKEVIVEVSAGDQSSPENVGQGYTDAFMVKFANEAMRDYYVGCLDKPCQNNGTQPEGGFCTAHDDFKVFVDPKLSPTNVTNTVEHYNPGVLVVDYKDVVATPPDQFMHSVFFRFKAGISAEQKAEARDKFVAMKDQCKGMTRVEAGDQNSKEPVHQQFEQGYFTVFDSEANLDFYLGCLDKPCQDGGQQPSGGYCEAHDDFKVFVGPLLNTDDRVPNLAVVDVENNNYHPGVFVFDFAARSDAALVVV